MRPLERGFINYYSKQGKCIMKIKVHKGLSWALTLCMIFMLLPMSVLAEDSTVANVSTAEAFQTAVATTAVTTINITGNFDTTQKLVVSRPMTINGNSNTITFAGDEVGWQGNYVLEVYNTTDVTIGNIKLTGGDAALLVNGSAVTLTGTIDVSGNAFGGIETGLGSGLETQPTLTVTDATLVNSTEIYGQPTIWEDGVAANRVIGCTFTKITKGIQPQYYLDANNAVDPDAPIADIAPLTISVNNVGTISGDTATAEGTLSYYLVSEDKQETIDSWNVETADSGVADALGVSAETSKPTLAFADNGKYLVVVETKDSKVVAAGQSAVIDIDSPYTITEISAETTGGAGITRTIATTGTNGTQYLVVQITEGTGDGAHVSVVMVKADDSVTISYKTTAMVQAWLTDGMPTLSGSTATGATIYDTETAE